MSFRTHIVFRAVIVLYGLFFLSFSYLYHHPRVHYLSADLNYTDISDYASVVHSGHSHSENVVHMHECGKEAGGMCLLCTLFINAYESAPVIVVSRTNEYTQIASARPAVLLLQSSAYRIPSLRAPPAV